MSTPNEEMVTVNRKEWEKNEKAMEQLIDERDKAEEFGSHLYYLITGRSPEWSNLFGYDQATEDVDDAQRTLRECLKQAEAALAEARKTPPATGTHARSSSPK